MTKNIHISVAWPYANGDLHVGHLAGAYLPADIFARYQRLKGNKVLMVSGSDSHGTPIVVEANKRGITPREVFEHYHERFLLTQQKIGISYDLFTHTDTENHRKIAQDFFLKLLEKGHLKKETQELLYSEKEERFLPDRFVEGTCYICGYESARGDQCDNCGNLMETTKLINPHSISDPSDKLVVRSTEHYFLDLPQFIDQLTAYLDSHEGHWRPQVMNFSKNFAKDLKARPITRDIDWGIDVPLDDFGDKKMYVWFEAVMGYFTASVEWAKNNGQPDAWKDWWYNPENQGYCFIGKDNIPFHTVIWQSELMGVERLYEDDESKSLQLPYDVPANEFMNIEGKQFSKSRNWAIWLPDILERFQPDAVRYYVARTLPETADSDFTWDGFYTRVNNELLAAWGNLVNRVVGFAYKRYDGIVPVTDELTIVDNTLIERIESGFETVGSLLEQVKLREALTEAMALAREVNGYLDERAPWKTYKEDKNDAGRSIYTALRAIDNLKIILSPFLPFSSQQVHEMLGYDGQLFGDLKIEEYTEDERKHKALIYDPAKQTGTWEKSNLQQGQKLREPQPLYTKLEPEVVDEEQGRLGAPYEEKPIEV
ncbi:methionine--tRNA ligase [Phototrophicus methaneseepsis]|uniref:Methionine--tRNA ligase n=1 Tax=Phototrophicus methaneseepsis TaxID=2710758 RepID=A0A7S8E9M5_9CHLR|nr:methionine--tRNA ligase [Phototrophicus methaneseepsis]QPC82789.1 methionine--tRNA ligase [Phototrophicus methaneseepsis]